MYIFNRKSSDTLLDPINRIPIHKTEILVAGSARNIGQHIESDIHTLFSATQGFKRVYGLVIESDSDDDTLIKLAALKSRLLNFDYTSLGKLKKQMPKRTERLADARNRIVDEVRSNPRYAKIDYIVLADLDGINRDITLKKIVQCWNVEENWDVVTANQNNIYFDIWALRHPDWSPIDCQIHKKKLLQLFEEPAAHNLAVNSKRIKLNPNKGLIEVDSAFGGLDIYKRQAFLAGRYEGLDERGDEVCEHLKFYYDLKQKGYRIYISSALINGSGPVVHMPRKLKYRIYLALKIIQKTGLIIFGQERFNKYLDRLKTPIILK